MHMAIKTKSKKRIYIPVSSEVEESLNLLSAEKNKSIASVASDLLEKAIEIEEDIIWAQVAEERKKSKGRLLSHKEVWQ